MAYTRDTYFRQGGMQQPGLCDICNTSACGTPQEGGVFILERPEDPWGNLQFGARCIRDWAFKTGLKPERIVDEAVKTASDLLTENDKLRKENAELEQRLYHLREELAASFAGAASA